MAFSTINKGSLYQNTKLYTGNAASQGDGSTQTFTDIGFGPDLVWIKNRDGTDWHDVTDTVRGATKSIYPNTNDEEDTVATALTAFTSTGFTIGSNNQVNNSPDDYVAWNWKANGAGSANTDGSISSTVSVNTTAGFSIVKYTGTGSADTIGHGLGAVPKMIISKRLDTTSYWITYHEAIGNDKEIYLNDTSAAAAAANTWNSTTPTSSVWSVKTDSNNTSGGSFISYVFADVAGYSKFGSYIGNSSTNGPFVYTGFRPSFLICKATSGGEGWVLFDNKRLGYNVDNNYLNPNSNAAEATSDDVDLLSNGFKFRTLGSHVNASGITSYIYMAFGQPIISNGGVSATAR